MAEAPIDGIQTHPWVLDDFTISKTLGKGTAGVAYLALNKREGVEVCLKVIEGSFCNESETMSLNDATWEEINVLKKLQHPHVIGYLGCFTQAHRLYVVMEYAGGGDLEKVWLEAQKSHTHFSEPEVIGWVQQIAHALQYVHSQKVLHRDLKLANVFLTSKREIKLGDFGLARKLETMQYMAQTMCGTPYYISPELCRGETYNSKADMW